MSEQDPIGKRVSFESLTGTVIELHLKADRSKSRKSDIYRIQWDNGKTGLLEINDRGLRFIDY